MTSSNEKMHWLWWPLLTLSLAAAGWFAYAVSQRLLYPHELEWMEGALADHAARVADGLPLYCEPSAEHVPFLYAPLLFWLGGLGVSFGVDGIIALRVIACGFSVGSAMLIGHWVRVESGKLVPGLVATGMFLAGYGWLAWWFDLARNDSLFVFLALASSYQLRHGGARRWLWAALLATAALLAKQSALMWLPAVGVGCLCLDWRIALKYGIASAVSMGIAAGLLHATTDGWSTFYLFEMPSLHGVNGDRKLGFWTEDLVPMAPVVLLGSIGFVTRVRSEAGSALYLAAVGSGGLLASWLSRMHVGGFDNVMMYGFAGGCVLAGVAAANPAKSLRVVAPALLLAQFAWLGYAAYARGAATLFPSAAHTRAHEQLRDVVRAQDGPVWIPGHGHIAYRAGKGTGAHGQAIFDILQLIPKLPDGMMDLTALVEPAKLAHLPERAQLAVRKMMEQSTRALSERSFSALIIDDVGAGQFTVLFGAGLVGADALAGTDDDPYRRAPGHAVTDPGAIRPLVGYKVHSPYVMQRRPQ